MRDGFILFFRHPLYEYVENVRRRCRAHQERQTKIANNGGPEGEQTSVVTRSNDERIQIRNVNGCDELKLDSKRITVELDNKPLLLGYLSVVDQALVRASVKESIVNNKNFTNFKEFMNCPSI